MTSRYASTHENPQGPGDARPTALQIVKDNDLLNNLTGKVALITGISSGIGLETALALKATGMHVFGAVRNMSKASTALGPHLEPGKLELLELNLSNLSSVRACAAAFLSKSSTLNILITNAGLMNGAPNTTTDDGFELEFGTNHLAHFLLFQLLKPTLLASATPESGSRVIALSSVAHRSHVLDFEKTSLLPASQRPDDKKEQTYNPMLSYARSKLANIYMANEINRRYAPRYLYASSVMPGGIWTGIQISLPDQIRQAWKGDDEFQRSWKSAAQGAATSVYGAVARELEGVGGKYLEDCTVVGEAVDVADMACPGYAGFAFDQEAEERLWRVSCELVGVDEE